MHAPSKLQSYSDELDLDLTKPEDRFKWFLASVLFAKRISAETAKETSIHFEQEGLTSPDATLQAGWDRLVEILYSGSYSRYDFSIATNFLGIAKTLREKYHSLERLHAESRRSEQKRKHRKNNDGSTVSFKAVLLFF
jgi:hypothetical protein